MAQRFGFLSGCLRLDFLRNLEPSRESWDAFEWEGTCSADTAEAMKTRLENLAFDGALAASCKVYNHRYCVSALQLWQLSITRRCIVFSIHGTVFLVSFTISRYLYRHLCTNPFGSAPSSLLAEQVRKQVKRCRLRSTQSTIRHLAKIRWVKNWVVGKL